MPRNRLIKLPRNTSNRGLVSNVSGAQAARRHTPRMLPKFEQYHAPPHSPHSRSCFQCQGPPARPPSSPQDAAQIRPIPPPPPPALPAPPPPPLPPFRHKCKRQFQLSSPDIPATAAQQGPPLKPQA